MLKDGAKQLNIELSDNQLKQFDMYMKLLLEYNEKFNLTAITDPEEITTKHFLDCLAIIKHIPENTNLVDVGSGAGFPGMVIKIARPDVRVTLMDALNKRVDFLRTVGRELGLDGLDCVHLRAEDAGKDSAYRATYDVVTSRAVAGMNMLSEYSLPLVKIGGFMLAMKSQSVREEFQEATPLIEKLGGEAAAEYFDYSVPFTDITYTIVKIRKTKETPDNFPRRAKRVGT